MSLDLDFVLQLMGAAFVFFGLYIRLGNLKQVYWKSPRSMTGYIPLGLVFIAANYLGKMAEQPPAIYYAFIALFAVLVGITLWFTARPPAFIQPDWVRWVEKHPEHIQKAMAAEAEDNKDWKKNVVSEAAVDLWALQLSRKPMKKKS